MNNLFDLPPGIREQALYTSFLNMVPGLLMAGARSPNPAQAAQGYGSAIQGFTQGGQDYLNNWRNMQALGFATQKAQREEEAAAQREKSLAILRGGPPTGMVSESPSGERTAAWSVDPARYRGAMFDVAPQQAVEASLKPIPDPYMTALLTAMGRAQGTPQPSERSATERLIAGRNALLIKQSRGETLSDEDRLNLNSWNDALIKGYVIPEGGNLTRVSPGQGTILPQPSVTGGMSQAGPASPIMPQPVATPPAIPPQLQPQTQIRLKPLPRDVQDDLTSSLAMQRSLDDIAAGLHKSGRISGNIEKMKIWAGIGSSEGMAFDTAVRNFRVAAQALIKGIPSNFDVQTFINTLPDLGLPEQTNTFRYNFAQQTLKELVATKIGYYKGLQYQIPDEIMALASDLGIGDVPAITQSQAAARLNALQKGMTDLRGGTAKNMETMSLEDAASLDLSDPKNREQLDQLLKARGF